MNFDYNTTRPALLYAEYGRNIQNMVKYIKTLESKEERNKHAQAVIDLMGFLNPHLRDVADFKHKLWDHLFIIADFDLDVDSPYPIPSKESLDTKPDKVSYPSNHIRYKHYGKTVEHLIEKARAIEEPDKKAQMTAQIANFMKMSYVNWNKDNVSDDTIINDLKIISKGELILDESTNLNKVEVRPVNKNPRNNFKQRNNNNNNNRNKKSNGKHRY
jgi:Domain of unknown function (DUF4290)